ncbi:hypothetical protein MNBD_GAMMA23-469 [hydrothermal vent metagenome]|uniref:Antitoxin Xre/MbcA/ParS-like toxin-binding domain-containing protein n=1 Tax=hydrothermal vent metagenome TaxID=652676 RepID=A0A3B0ZNK6_9ZZZZ
MSIYDDPEERKDLVRRIFQILNDWKIALELQAILVGLPTDTKTRELTKIKNGKAFPDEDEFMRRAFEIISINKGLKLVFPGNSTLGNLWVTTPSYNFNDCAPVEVMLASFEGLQEINRHLHGRW